jgi:alkane 1-monooxygenase
MNWRPYKYALPLIVFAGAWISFNTTGIAVWLPVLYAFILIPTLELLLRPSGLNMDEAEEDLAKANPVYDWFLYLIVPLQYVSLVMFLNNINQPWLTNWDRAGRIVVMGLQCGVFGINVAHELGHRIKPFEQFLAKSLLVTALYMHFFIEHNRGHHKNVGTPQDPSTAPYGQSLYRFWIRSITGIYMKSWEIASDEQQKQGKSWWQNEMLQYQLIQLGFCLLIGTVFGWTAMACFLGAALTGILLLETVNYIEHYGLSRKPIAEGKYERAKPEHSWNSNHVVGRLMLFELSRHSDHHYLASKKYQTLRHHDNSPQLPTGYPGSMILALLPPLWFSIMNKRIKEHTISAESITPSASWGHQRDRSGASIS